jgi:cellobiose phosphorylase
MVALGIKSEAPAVEVNLASMKTMDGQATFDAESFEVGSAIFVVTEDGKIPAPQGEYAMEDGTIVKVDDKGYIVEISTKEEEAPEAIVEETVMEDAPMKEQIVEEMAKPKKLTETTTKVSEFSAEISEIREELNALKMKLSSVTEERDELVSRLASEEAPRSFHSPEANPVNSIKFKIGEKRAESVTDRVFNQLFK